MRLKDKIAVISGGTSGIELSIAKRFVKEGTKIFIFGRRKDALDEAVRVIGGNVTAIQADASKLKDLDHVTDVVRKAKGKVDILVSNAGFTKQVPLREITEDHYDRIFDLMAKGPLFLTQKMLPLMDSVGSIILVFSAMHYMGLANHSAS
jgi:NAD(P)-dependent dehydrogenase (short-subunit alcohol dehydrogenase family)